MDRTQRLPPPIELERRSPRRRLGDRAERLVATQLAALGWTILAASVQVGRDEIDLICVEPSLPPMLVFVEVRSHTTDAFGAPEESVDAAKVARIYRAAMTLLRARRLPDGRRLPPLHWRVDLVAVDGQPTDGDEFARVGSRHVRGITPA